MFAYSSRTEITIYTKLGNASSLRLKRYFRKVWKSVLSSSPFESGSCSSETKHDGRTAPRPKLIVSKRKLRKQIPEPRKTVLWPSPGEDIFVARKLSTIEEQGQDQSCLFRRRDYRKKDHNFQKVYWVLASVKVDSLARRLSSIEAGNPKTSIAIWTVLNITLSQTSLT
jgi:hypothetical protein